VNARPRFAQLTYTSFQRADGSRGGWQVKDVRGGPTAAERDSLVERVATTTEKGRLPRFLTPEEVDALPRRLAYGPVPGGGAAYWHTVPAGVDGAQRPGNVFAHVVLDRRPGEPEPPLRTSDLLRSPAWLRPFGAEEVLATTLDPVPDPPWPGGGFDRPAVLEFLAQKARWRAGTLVALLDGVVAAMEGGPMVVLGVDEAGGAERWIAALCHLMAPGTSRGLYFATAERGGGVEAARGAGLHLVAVPCPDLGGIAPDDDRVVLIGDEDDAVDFVALEADEAAGYAGRTRAHTTRHGSRIAVTPWSAIVPVVLRDPRVAARTLARQDAVAAELGDRGLACSWPLAMAAARDPGGLDDALPAAELALRGWMPRGVVPGGRPHQILAALHERTLGRSTAEALTAVDRPGATAEERAYAVTVYLERALHDPEWLRAPGGVPVPEIAPERREPDVVAQARARLDRLAVDGSSAVEALRLLDLTVRAGLLAVRDGPSDDDAGLVRALLDRHAAALGDPVAGTALADEIGPLAEATQAAFVRPWFDDQLSTAPGEPGCRLPPALLRWLFPQPPAPPAPRLLARPGALPPTLLEAAAQATLVLPDPSAFRPAALVAGASLDRAAAGPPLHPDEVAGLLDAREPAGLLPVVAAALLASGPGPALDVLVDRVRTAAWSGDATEVVAAARLRHLEAAWCGRVPGDDPRLVAGLLAEVLDRHLEGQTPLPDDLVLAGMAADVADRLNRRSRPDRGLLALRPVAGDVARRLPAVARRLADAAQRGVVTDLDVVLAAQVTVWPPDGPALGHPSWDDLAQAQWAGPTGQPERLLDHVVRIRASAGAAADVPDLVVEARRQVHEKAAAVAPTDAGRLAQGYDRFAVAWWRSVGVTAEAALGPLVRRRWR
jgi:GTPase-associated protein 1, N-terminal domain type 2/GTPase-associated protein 1, middle domain